MSTFINDLKYAIRQLRKSLGFTLCTVLVLSLGIAANTAFFSALDGICFRSLPFAQSDRIMSVWSKSLNPRHSHFPMMNCSFLDYQDWVEQNTVFEELAAQGYRTLNLTGRGEPLALTGWAITENLFDVFKKPPILGRSFLPEEMSADQSQVVILSHALWQQAFGADPAIVGQDIALDKKVYSVVGIAHPDMDYRQGFKSQFYLPMTSGSSEPRYRHSLQALGRLHPDVTPAAASIEMKIIAARLEAQYPQSNAGFTTLIIPLQELLFGKVRGTIVILFAAAVLLLLIACTNVANLLLSRMDRRSQEMAVRSALGAGRWQLCRVILVESFVVSLIAGMVGFIGAAWGMGILRQAVSLLASSGGMAGVARIEMNPWILLFALGLSVVVTLCFGLLPAWKTSQANPLHSLRAKGRGSSQGRQGRRVSNLLASAEIALAFILLVGASLLLKSLTQLHRSSPGFNPVNMMTMRMNLPQTAAYKDDQHRAAFCRAVLERLRTVPGVTDVASTNIHPVSDYNFMCGFRLLDRENPLSSETTAAEFRTVSTNYFSTLGLPLVKGRLFQETDDGRNKVMIVDQEFARRYFPDKNPIGQRIELGGPCEIIGVVGNHQTSTQVKEQTCPHMYKPISQACLPSVTFIARIHADPLTLAEPLRRAIWAVDSQQPINAIQPMQGIVRDTHAIHRLSSLVLGLFASSALLITVIGIYGVIASAVTQRTREIGIRMAFGARHIDVLKAIMQTGLLLTGLGLVAGLAGALALCRLMSTLLYNISPFDLLSYSFVIVFITTISLLACYFPARRAAKIDPMGALRYE
jgi:putative ABC transport system permease protein